MREGKALQPRDPAPNPGLNAAGPEEDADAMFDDKSDVQFTDVNDIQRTFRTGMSAGLGANERSKLKGLSHKGKKLKAKL